MTGRNSSSSRIEPLSVEFVEPAAANHSPEVALLAALLRQAIVKSTRIEAIPAEINWEAFVDLAQENRVLLIAARELQHSGLSAPGHVLKTVERYRALTLSLNGANLVTLRAMIEAFAAAGIDVINIKGPVALSVLHGDPFIRPSSDIDLLVRSRDFRRAGEVVKASGYKTPRGADTFWWRTFLGEQHYFQEGKPPIDLHHRVQQPGSPSPRSMEPFWSQRTNASVGKADVPVLSSIHACLLACVSLAKAITNRETAGAHAFDIAACLATRSPTELGTLFDAARRLGLMNTLCFGVSAARALFGVDIAGLPLQRSIALANDADFANVVLDPDATTIATSHRTRLLLKLCDAPADLVREQFWMIAAHAARIATTPGRRALERRWAAERAEKR